MKPFAWTHVTPTIAVVDASKTVEHLRPSKGSELFLFRRSGPTMTEVFGESGTLSIMVPQIPSVFLVCWS